MKYHFDRRRENNGFSEVIVSSEKKPNKKTQKAIKELGKGRGETFGSILIFGNILQGNKNG